MIPLTASNSVGNTSNEILIRHIVESHKIEGIYQSGNSPIFQDHVRATYLVAKRGARNQLVTPLEIGKAFMPQNRVYRREDCYIGDRMLPRPQYVPFLMDRWLTAWLRYDHYLAHSPDAYWRKWAVNRAWMFHHWYLCIHPFDDGNGRTARLLLNSFRLRAGLQWHVVLNKKYDVYQASIQHFEDNTFKQWMDFWEPQLMSLKVKTF